MKLSKRTKFFFRQTLLEGRLLMNRELPNSPT